MAKSIIDVEVNDEPFQEFLRLFEQYRAGVAEMPEEWAKTGDTVADVAGDFDAMVTAMRKQQALQEQTARNRAAEARAEREELKTQQEQQKALRRTEEDRARTVNRIAQDSKSIAKSTLETTAHLIAWVGLGGILTGLLGAGGLWGLDGLANRASDARRSAQGIGISPGQQQALGVNFQRYFDVNQNLENIVDAQNNYANRWAFTAMGIQDAQRRNPADLAVEMAIRAKEIFDRGDQSQQYAQSQGLLQFYTMDELRRLHAISMEELRGAGAGYRRDSRQMGMSDDVYRQWQVFSVQMQRAGRTIENAFITGLQPLTPALTELSQAVASTIASFLARPELKEWIKGLGDQIHDFADYLGSPEFHSDLDRFWSGIRTIVGQMGAVVDGLYRLGVKLHLITPVDENGRPLPTPQEQAAINMGSREYVEATRDAAVSRVTAMGFFTGQGWRTHQAAGLVANLNAESGMNPFAMGDPDKEGRYQAYGIAQWHKDRQREYERLFGHTMQSVRDRQQALTEQLMFIQYELTQGREQRAGNMLGMSGTAYEAGSVVSRYYERPADTYGEAARRGQQAQALVTITIQNQTGANVSTTGAQIAR